MKEKKNEMQEMIKKIVSKKPQATAYKSAMEEARANNQGPQIKGGEGNPIKKSVLKKEENQGIMIKALMKRAELEKAKKK
jgi:23S rRNA maturation mini-RNase III